MTDETDIVSRIMDRAATADRRALFAALQAALFDIIEAEYGGNVRPGALERVERALTLGAEYGSPEQLDAIDNTGNRPGGGSAVCSCPYDCHYHTGHARSNPT